MQWENCSQPHSRSVRWPVFYFLEESVSLFAARSLIVTSVVSYSGSRVAALTRQRKPFIMTKLRLGSFRKMMLLNILFKIVDCPAPLYCRARSLLCSSLWPPCPLLYLSILPQCLLICRLPWEASCTRAGALSLSSLLCLQHRAGVWHLGGASLLF